MKKSFCFALALFLALLALPGTCQTSRVVTYAIKNLPKQILLTKGDILEISDDQQTNELNSKVWLQCRDLMLASSETSGKWSLKWATENERFDSKRLVVWQIKAGQKESIGQTVVTLVQKSAFHLKTKTPEDSALPVDLNVIADSSFPVSGVHLMADGEPISVTRRNGIYQWTPHLKPGLHILIGSVTTTDDMEYCLRPVNVEIKYSIAIRPLPFGATLLRGKINGAFTCQTHIDPRLQVQEARLFLADNAVLSRNQPPFDTFDITPRDLSDGNVNLRFEVTTKEGWHITSPACTLHVVTDNSNAPALPVPTDAAVNADYSLQISTAGNDIAPQQIALLGKTSAAFKEVNYYCDGRPLLTASSNALTAYWDIRTVGAGLHHLWADALTENNTHCITRPVEVNVPERITFAALPKTFTVDFQNHTLPVQLNFAAGLHPRQVRFLADGKVLSEQDDVTGYFELEGAGLSDGTHTLSAEITNADNAEYRATPVKIEVSNKIKLAAVVEDKNFRKDLSDFEKLDRQWVVTRKRYQIAEPYLFKKDRRTGVKGFVRGLAVMEKHTVISAYGTIYRYDWETGSTLPIDVSAVRGTGRVDFTSPLADNYPISGMRNAVEFCKTKIIALRRTFAWQTYDLAFQHGDGATPIGGPSAGAADAVALMSLLLGCPVDSSVALTGEITADGLVRPVGGVFLKAQAAFSDPQVRTLIVPAGMASRKELIDLYCLQPEIFIGKKIIMASNMEQVFRQALIGYSSDYEQVQELVRQAMLEFVLQRDLVGFRYLREAEQLTPEDMTLYAYEDWIRREAQKNPIPSSNP